MASISFKTGRNRTLTFSGDIVCGANATYACVNGLIAVTTQTGSYLTIKCQGLEIDIRPSVSSTGYSIGDPCPGNDHGTRISAIGVQVYFNGSEVANQSQSNTLAGMLGSVSVDGSGTWQVSAEVEEWCVISDLGDIYPNDVTVMDGRQFPNFGGDAAADQVGSKVCTFVERFVEGSQIGISCTSGQVTASTSVSPIDGQLVTYSIETIAFVEAYLSPRTAAVTYSLNNNPFGVVYQVTNDYGNADTTFGASVYCNGNVSGPGDAGHSWQVDALIAYPVNYQADIFIQTFLSEYPQALLFHLRDKQRLIDGQWVWSDELLSIVQRRTLFNFSQNEYLITSLVDRTIPFPGASASEISPIRGWLDAHQLALNHETVNDWRTLIRGKPYLAMTVAQSASLGVASAVSSGGASITFNPSTANWEGFRYLSFDANGTGTMMIQNAQGLQKTYNFTAGSPTQIDLCLPSAWNQLSGILPSIDSRESRYPMDSTGQFPDEIGQGSFTSHGGFVDAKGAYWGIFYAQTVTIAPTNSGVAFTAGPFNLVRKGSNRASFLMPFEHEILAQMGGSVQYRMLGKIYSDEKEALNLPAISHLPGTSFSDFTLADMANQISACPGWVASLAASFPDSAWHDANGPAAWSMGSGAYYEGGANGIWTAAIDRQFADDQLEVLAQPLYDQVQGYPAIGDPWEGSGYPASGQSDAMPVRFAKLMRSRAEGLTLPGPTSISIYDPPNSAVASSSGSANSENFYETGLPYILNSDEVAVSSANPSQTPNFTYATSPRLSRRVSFLVQNHVIPRLDESDDGWLVEVDLQASSVGGADVICKTSYSPIPPFAISNQITFSGGFFDAHPCILSDQRIAIAALQNVSGQINLLIFVSFDAGQTFQTGETFTNMQIQQVDIRCAPDGGVLLIGYVPNSGSSGPGAFTGTYRASMDAAWQPFFQLTDGSEPLQTDGTGFGFDAAFDSAGRWALVFIPNSGSSPALYTSADQGRTWELRGS